MGFHPRRGAVDDEVSRQSLSLIQHQQGANAGQAGGQGFGPGRIAIDDPRLGACAHEGIANGAGRASRAQDQRAGSSEAAQAMPSQIVQKANPVRVIAEQPAASAEKGVDGADCQGVFADAVEAGDNRLFVRDRHIGPGDAGVRLQCGNAPAQVFGRCLPQLISPIGQPQRGECGVVHPRRGGVGDRITEKANPHARSIKFSRSAKKPG